MLYDNFKTFQVYSSFIIYQFVFFILVQFQNFSSLQFMTPTIPEFRIIFIFQNFSSLQFILQKKKIRLLLKTISKLFKFIVHKIRSNYGIIEVKFQNFSSLQFMLQVRYYKSVYPSFQNFSSLQFIGNIKDIIFFFVENFKTFQVYSS